MKTTITVRFEIEAANAADAMTVVDTLLDNGAIQDEINDHCVSDVGDLTVTSACVVLNERAETPVYTAPYGSRGIYRDGKPFVSITRNDDSSGRPVDVDDFARLVLSLLNGGAK